MFGDHRKKQTQTTSSKEKVRERYLQFWDLTDPKKAKEHDAPPGYYFTVEVSLDELQDSMLIQKFTMSFFAELKKAGLMERSGVNIALDTQQKMIVDPALSWMFTQVGYIDEQHLLLVQAVHIDADKSQRMIIEGLRRK